MPAQKSVEWNFEELLIQKLSASGNYAGMTLVHPENRERVPHQAIVFTCTKGGPQHAGIEGHPVTCEVSFDTLKTDDQDAGDLLLKQISEDIFSDSPVTYNLPDVVFASIEQEESSSSREELKKFIKRTFIVRGIVKTIN